MEVIQIDGALTVNGLTTTIHTGNVVVQDKTLELGSGDTNLNGGGLILGDPNNTNHSILYNDGDWELSENLDIAAGKTYKINGDDVLSSK